MGDIICSLVITVFVSLRDVLIKTLFSTLVENVNTEGTAASNNTNARLPPHNS